MQVALRIRDSLSNPLTLDTEPVDVSGMPLLVMVLMVYNFTGTNLTATLQTSDDLQTWDNVGSAITATTTGAQRSTFLATSQVYGRYVRVRLALTGSGAAASYSLWINTYPAS